jgi:hypothetical protein
MDLKEESVRTYAGLIWLKRKFSRGFLSTESFPTKCGECLSSAQLDCGLKRYYLGYKDPTTIFPA